jgi:hypothetical protein
MTLHRRHTSVSVTIVETDPGWSQFDFEPATTKLLKDLEDDDPAAALTERIKPTQSEPSDQTVPPARDGFFNVEPESDQQPVGLLSPSFKSEADHSRAVPDRLSGLAGAAMAAAAFVQAMPIAPPERYEFRFCLPGPRAAIYRDIRTSQTCFLQREANSSTFIEI